MGSIVPVLVAVLAVVSVKCGDICYPEKFTDSSVVCVCNVTHCSEIGEIVPEQNGKAVMYQSSLGGKRFERTTLQFVQSEPMMTINDSHVSVTLGNGTYQKIIGFGGAFTDSAGVNWDSLKSVALKRKLIEAYYGVDGLEYNIGRIPMGGCDFSTRDYTYDDSPGDMELKNFSLAMEDNEYKIPMILLANKLSDNEIFYFGSPWSAPAWMKNTGTTYGRSWLIGDPGGPYYKTWAQYFVKFYNAYKGNGIKIWGFTLQNEPLTGYLPRFSWQTMAMSPYTQRGFLKKDLGPVLFQVTKGDIKLMILDDQRIVLPWWANVVFADPEASQYAAGVGVHWYMNAFRSPNALDATYKNHPDKFILATEACEGSKPFRTVPVALGSWERAESYAYDILTDLRHFVSGWTDWNLALDLQGGPNWVKNYVDAPIIVDASKQVFYKQPMYYALGHFSKFLPRDSLRLQDQLTVQEINVDTVTFLRPDHGMVTVIVNRNTDARTVKITDVQRGKLVVNVEPKSVSSVLWY